MKAPQRAGKDLDNDVANALTEMTLDDVRVLSTRGSGNTKYGCLDVLVVDKTTDTVHDIELKRSSVNVGETVYYDLTDMGWVPSPRWFGMKFTHREMCVVEANGIAPTQSVAESFPSAFDPTITSGGQLRLRKPQTDKWPSQQKGDDDAEVVALTLSLPLDESNEDRLDELDSLPVSDSDELEE